MSSLSKGLALFVGLEGVFVGLGIDACGALEVAAEIGSSGETELIRGFLYCLFGIRIHEQFGLRDDVLLNPFEGRNAAARLAEQFGEILLVIIEQGRIVVHIAVFLVVLHNEVCETVIDVHVLGLVPPLILFAAVIVDKLVSDGELDLQHLPA